MISGCNNPTPISNIMLKKRIEKKNSFTFSQKKIRDRNRNIMLSLCCNGLFLFIRSCSQNQTLNMICEHTLLNMHFPVSFEIE